MSRLSRSVRAVAVLAALTSCDGFGRAVVGTKGSESTVGPACRDDAASCASELAFTPLTADGAPTVPLFACGNGGVTCGPRDVQGQSCNFASEVSEGTNAPVSLRCAQATFTAAMGAKTITLPGLTASSAQIILEAVEPVTFELPDLQLTNSRIELHGPIALHVSGVSGLQNSAIVDVNSEPGASVELEEIDTTTFWVVDLKGPLSVARSKLFQTHLFADTVDLENNTATTLDVKADTIVIVELNGQVVSLEFGQATISASTLRTFNMQSCDRALLVSTIIDNAKLGACRDVLRTDRGAISNGLAAGSIVSHVMFWDHVTFGVGGRTSLESWEDTITNNRFCVDVTRMTIGGATASMTCNDCAETIPNPPALFCAVPDYYEMSGAAGQALPPEVASASCPAILEGVPCDPAPAYKSPY